eukprot:TRINITY_DN542_c0_g4_i1.p1 TRINITY_DN542_c0_g4~~TRINITY_DN542_c0_g4_i1.p1  ORF type:complete len:529 (+),score=51.04 TRINITY_DN542_c0_g4_i1:196-1782(+)
MACAWPVNLLLGLLDYYPEIFLAIFSFFFVRFRCCKNACPNWPVIGMLPTLLSNFNRMHEWGVEILRESGLNFMFKGPWFAQMDSLVTCDPANTNHIFITNFSNFPKGSDFLEIFDVLGDGIFNSDSDSWRIQRRIAHTIMSSGSFRRFGEKTSREKVENGLIPLLDHTARRGLVVDLQDLFMRFTFDSTYILVFGTDPGCLSDTFPMVPFAKALDEVEEVLLSRHVVPKLWWKLLRWLKIGEEKKLAEAWETIDHFITQNISTRKMDGSDGSDLLTSYINYRLDDELGSGKSDKFLRDTAVNFMLAGRDTTGVALTWFFWLVSQNPDVETKILEELRMKLADRDEGSQEKPVVFDPKELGGLVYLHGALCESLRLFPPVPFEHKSVTKSDILPSGHKVSRTTKIFVSLYAMGRMEGIWGEDCLEFKPERWITERGRAKFEPSYKFLAFNSGPRTCLGKDVAFTQMKAVVAAMLYNFHVEVIQGHPVCPKMSIILHMKNGLMVRVRERCNDAKFLQGKSRCVKREHST